MKTILIIEDDIVFSRSISNWLVKKGIKPNAWQPLRMPVKPSGKRSST